jgi:hemerythrin
MAIIWRKNMSVSNDTIDHDHHFMVNFVNTIELVLQAPDEKKMLLEVFEQLYEYAVNHFKREETIQRKIEYPKSIQHKNSHSTLLKQLETLIKEINEINSPEEINKKAPEIIEFVRSWLLNHVFNEDMLLKPYLEKHARALS